jgi:hypothetical protein
VAQGVPDAPLEVCEDLAAIFYALHAGDKVVVDRDHVAASFETSELGMSKAIQIGTCEHGAVVDAVAGDADDATKALGTLDDLEPVMG